MTTTAFINANVFDGVTPHLLADRCVVVEDGLIREISEDKDASAADRVIDAAGRTLMPGLIDLHVHIWFAELDVTRVAALPTEYLALFAANTLQSSLDRGFTTLRDAGGTDGGYALAIERGLIKSPRFYHTGRVISQTGGHGEFRASFEQDLTGCVCCPPRYERFVSIADGADAVRKAVREEFRRGSRAIKMMCSGGVTSPSDPIDKLQYTDAEILAAVEEANMRGSYVFAHCHPDAAIKRCAELGVRCIEHASMITPETARLLAEKAVYAVPTLAVVKALNDDGAQLGVPAASMKKLSNLYDYMLRGLEYMKTAGVKMGFGTDLLAQHQVRQSMEFEIRADVLSAHDVLISATSVAAEILMEDGKLGVIAPGAYADVLLVDGNPLDDVRLLAKGADVIPVIMKAGQFHKLTI
jgi:imidazolonepropionase-like amidohydrolase